MIGSHVARPAKQRGEGLSGRELRDHNVKAVGKEVIIVLSMIDPRGQSEQEAVRCAAVVVGATILPGPGKHPSSSISSTFSPCNASQ